MGEGLPVQVLQYFLASMFLEDIHRAPAYMSIELPSTV